MKDPALALSEIVAKGCVSVVSVHHTGTVSALQMLQWHSAITGVQELGSIVREDLPILKSRIVHFHLMGKRIDSRGHIEASMAQIKQFVKNGRTLIPLRDPMLSLISRESRNPGWNHRFIVDGFFFLRDLEPSAWLRYDNLWTEQERRDCLSSILPLIGLSPEPFICRIARDWPKHNSVHNEVSARLKSLYEQGDIEGLRNQFPKNFDYLVENRHHLIPFLKSHGYEDLPWWNV